MAIENSIPFFVQAPSAPALRKAMVMNNAKSGMTFHYFDIQSVNGRWYAWYYKQLNTMDKQEVVELDQEK